MKEAAELETNPNRIILLKNIQIKNIQVHLGDIYGNEFKKRSNYGNYHNFIVKYKNGQQISDEVLDVAGNHIPTKGFYVKNN